MKIGIVINSRLTSSRLPRKAMTKINGKPMIQHLVDRLKSLNIPVVIAVPVGEYMDYIFLNDKNKVSVFQSLQMDDPLARMTEAALVYGFDYVVRITHDKIFVDTALLLGSITHDLSTENPPDYIYLKNSIPGTAFEIISTKALIAAASRFKDIEYIGYAVRRVTSNIKEIDAWKSGSQGMRLLVDYPEDLNLMHVIFSQLGNDCTLNEVISYLISNYQLKYVNRLPDVTIYTCAYNADKWIDKAMISVLSQKGILFEYLLIDDFSIDRTPERMALATANNTNCRYIRNEKNIGLASSSNVALRYARGKYIIRLDADDEFINDQIIANMVSFGIQNSLEAIYPDHLLVDTKEGTARIKGNEHHHVGGALFDRAALNYVKFTEGLRGYDSLDIFTRARSFLKFGYYDQVGFLYYQTEGSLSRSNLPEREKIKEAILRGTNEKI